MARQLQSRGWDVHMMLTLINLNDYINYCTMKIIYVFLLILFLRGNLPNLEFAM